MMVDQEEKELYVQLWAESGMSKRAYAREHGINRNTFYGWCSKEESKEQKEDTKLVEIKLEKSRKKAIGERKGSITLQTVNGYRLQITDNFEKQLLQELLDVLEVR